MPRAIGPTPREGGMSVPGTILITGANRGIGLGLTGHFLARGWCVLAACRRPAEAADLATLARAHPDRCEVSVLDVGDAASVAGLAANLLARPISLDVLVNNAGINPAPRDAGVDRV